MSKQRGTCSMWSIRKQNGPSAFYIWERWIDGWMEGGLKRSNKNSWREENIYGASICSLLIPTPFPHSYSTSELHENPLISSGFNLASYDS